MRGLVIAAPASGQGKTVVTLGLLRALRDRGAPIVSGKSGPDYIDPAFHVAATGRASVTLDAWAAPAEQVRARALMQEREGAELLVVEGAMGAFDGAASASVPAGPASGSAAALAAALGAPMVLVLDVSHMAQSAGALVHGMAAWAEAAGTRLAGVILNRVASPRHGAMVEGAVQATCPVLGAVPRDADLSIPSRHLGLVQAAEQRDLEDLILRAAGLVASGVDLDALEGMAAPIAAAPVPRRIAPLGQRIAVARDEAFGFSYWHMLEDWGAQGAEVVPFSPLADEPADPTADAVFLPGGYPELHAGRIANAGVFRSSLIEAAARGALIYGECGGYMVLGKGLVDAEGHRHPMLGLLDVETSFAQRGLHLGYRRLEIAAGPWSGAAMAHEFHYASTLRQAGAPFARASDAAGETVQDMGLVAGRVMGSFAHVIELGQSAIRPE